MSVLAVRCGHLALMLATNQRRIYASCGMTMSVTRASMVQLGGKTHAKRHGQQMDASMDQKNKTSAKVGQTTHAWVAILTFVTQALEIRMNVLLDAIKQTTDAQLNPTPVIPMGARLTNEPVRELGPINVFGSCILVNNRKVYSI